MIADVDLFAPPLVMPGGQSADWAKAEVEISLQGLPEVMLDGRGYGTEG